MENKKGKQRVRIKIWQVTVILSIAIILAIVGSLLLFQLKRTPTEKTNATLERTKPAVVMFYSEDCPYCKEISGWVRHSDLRSQFNQTTVQNSVYLERHNKHDWRLFKKYHVRYTPSFMVLKKGIPQVVGSKNGVKMKMYVGTNKQAISGLYRNAKVPTGAW